MSLAGFWIIVPLAVLSANLAECQFNDPVPFPPALPSPVNIPAICSNVNGRSISSIPSSWGSLFRRRAKAINRLESWYKFCCGQGEQMKLCCAQQAWEQALSQFCEDEFSTKTVAYECCRRPGFERWKCFSTEPANPAYGPVPGCSAPSVQEQGFFFNSQDCHN